MDQKRWAYWTDVIGWPWIWLGIGILAGVMLAGMILGVEWPEDTQSIAFWIGDAGILTTLTIGAGLAGLILNNSNSNKTLRQAQIAEIAGRFQRGVELLASGDVASRMGGIHILRDVASQAPQQYHYATIDTLSGFMATRTRPQYDAFYRCEMALRRKEEPVESDLVLAFRNTEADVVLAFRTIGEMRLSVGASEEKTGRWSRRIRIERVLLCVVEVDFGDFSDVLFRGCIFASCVFKSCNFAGALVNCRLPYQNTFEDCDLRKANLDRNTGDWKIDEELVLELCDLRDARVVIGTPRLRVKRCRTNSKTDFSYYVPWFSQSWTDDDQPIIKAQFAAVPALKSSRSPGRYDAPTSRGFRAFVPNDGWTEQ